MLTLHRLTGPQRNAIHGRKRLAPALNNNTAASVTQFAYNSLGELTQITDSLGHATTMTYTTAGLIASITDPVIRQNACGAKNQRLTALILRAVCYDPGSCTTCFGSGSEYLFAFFIVVGSLCWRISRFDNNSPF